MQSPLKRQIDQKIL